MSQSACSLSPGTFKCPLTEVRGVMKPPEPRSARRSSQAMLVAWARVATQQCAVSVAPNVLIHKESAALSTTVALFRQLERTRAIPSRTPKASSKWPP